MNASIIRERLKERWGAIIRPSDSLILAFFLFLSVLVLLPTGIESRDQRYGNMLIFSILCMGLYSMRLNFMVGLLLSYSSIFMFAKVAEMPIVNVIIVVASLFVFVASSRDKRIQEAGYDLICATAIFNVMWQALQLNGIFWINIPLPLYASTGLVGLMGNTNETGAILAMSLPCFFRKRWALWIPVIIAGIMLSRSHGAAVTALIIVTTYGLASLRGTSRVSALLAVIVLFMAFLWIKPVDFKRSRIDADVYALNTWSYNIHGWGIGQFKYVFPLVSSFNQVDPIQSVQMTRMVYDQWALKDLINDKKGGDKNYFKTDKTEAVFQELHNEYIEWGFNAGIAGFLLLIAGLIHVAVIGIRAGSMSIYGLLASCLSALWFFPWHIIPTIIITIFFVADIVREGRHDSTNRTNA